MKEHQKNPAYLFCVDDCCSCKFIYQNYHRSIIIIIAWFILYFTRFGRKEEHVCSNPISIMQSSGGNDNCRFIDTQG